jgi:Protein of unknown function (DUF2591)
MLIKTSELIGKALNWAVAKCLPNTGLSSTHYWTSTPDGDDDFLIPERSTDWNHGGPILQQLMLDGMLLEAVDLHYRDRMPAFKTTLTRWNDVYRGETPLIATMRCYVASKMGNEVDIPKELL